MCDRPAIEPTEEVEITPEMIEAGATALLDSDFDGGRNPTALGLDGTVLSIIRAALEVGGFQISTNRLCARAVETR
jgi:hypothetical protein